MVAATDVGRRRVEKAGRSGQVDILEANAEALPFAAVGGAPVAPGSRFVLPTAAAGRRAQSRQRVAVGGT